MGIYLLSLSHKTTPLEVRSLFAYSEKDKERLLEELLSSGWIDEAVVLSTCNRMEIYCHGTDGYDREIIDDFSENLSDGSADDAYVPSREKSEISQVLEIMEQTALRIARTAQTGKPETEEAGEGKRPIQKGQTLMAGMPETGDDSGEKSTEKGNIGIRGAEGTADADIRRYVRRYYGRQAVHHLFQVAAGLDSMVIGEDQILGQVKQAYEFSHGRGGCKTCFHTLFRDVVTGAKRVKTDTLLSKTPVSTASLAVKAAEEHLGGLKGKKIMIIGATGKIGNIVLKNVQGISGLEVFVTMRSHSSPDKLGHGVVCRQIPYEDRYLWIDQMDVIVSATSSPHYTITALAAKPYLKTDKERVFLDLAVPPNIEECVGGQYFNIEDMSRLARRNNERKLAEVETANQIIEEYESRFYKWLLYRTYESSIGELRDSLIQTAGEKGLEAAVNRLFYQLREAGTVEEAEAFLAVADKVNAANRRAEQEHLSDRRKKGKNEQKAYFPLFFSLEGKKALVVGAGKIASRRASVLAEFGAQVLVVAPEGISQMEHLAQKNMVCWEKRVFCENDIEGCYLVIAATDDTRLNGQIVGLCHERQILVNHAGDRGQCDFYFPGIAREGGLVVGVTASGKDHRLAGEVTGRLQSWMKQFSQ